ncbi:MAG: bifunctional adenosylcobinamide kinase/adenosylcobinamide-phosphate guanylyltransferase [Candidatus Dadabacteria bacterium]|nr:MAG: bifunctional adenosylcobinamide kinase/adenosylcobinamide-phosphate guanylyltransferase [Candidatus Dadabacteria bacterium]
MRNRHQPVHRLILITGGARSGKSSFAEAMARQLAGDQVACIVTLDASHNDPEMAARIERHRARRPANWQTVEAPRDLAEALHATANQLALVDCLTVWLANRLEAAGDDVDESAVSAWIDGITAAAKARQRPSIIVTNEVGSGIVPMTPLGRTFRDLAGRANQRLGAAADEVWLMVAGQPLRLKPNENAPSWWTGRER